MVHHYMKNIISRVLEIQYECQIKKENAVKGKKEGKMEDIKYNENSKKDKKTSRKKRL